MLYWFQKKQILRLAFMLFVSASAYTPLNSHALSIDDIAVDRNVGQWGRKQSVYIDGKGVARLSLIGSTCLTDSSATLNVRDYVNRMMLDLGVEPNCSVSNLTEVTKSNLSFDMQCTSPETKLVSTLNVSYRYTRDKVRIKAEGTVQSNGVSSEINVQASSRLEGLCNDAFPEIEGQRLVGGDQPFNLLDAVQGKTVTDVASAKNKQIENVVKPSQLSRYLKSRKSNKPLVVHYSSTDRNCTHCIKDNKSIVKAHDALKGEFDFVQVIFNPWKSFTKKYRRLGGLPTTEIFDGVVPESTIKGFQANMEKSILDAHKKTQLLLNDDYRDVKIPTIASDELKGVVSKDRDDKILFVHLTSNNPKSCPFCIKNNSFIRAAAREFSGQYEFAEINYNQLSDLKADKILSSYLNENNVSVGGLPVVLFFGKKGQVNQRPGIWHTIINDVKANTKP